MFLKQLCVFFHCFKHFLFISIVFFFRKKYCLESKLIDEWDNQENIIRCSDQGYNFRSHDFLWYEYLKTQKIHVFFLARFRYHGKIPSISAVELLRSHIFPATQPNVRNLFVLLFTFSSIINIIFINEM